MKKKTLVVEDLRMINGNYDAAFKVKKITNSVTFKIGQYMSADEVDAYCIAPDWTVNVVGRK